MYCNVVMNGIFSILLYEGVHKWGYANMDGLEGTIPLRYMIWGVPPWLWKTPYWLKEQAKASEFLLWLLGFDHLCCLPAGQWDLSSPFAAPMLAPKGPRRREFVMPTIFCWACKTKLKTSHGWTLQNLLQLLQPLRANDICPGRNTVNSPSYFPRSFPNVGW